MRQSLLGIILLTLLLFGCRRPQEVASSLRETSSVQPPDQPGFDGFRGFMDRPSGEAILERAVVISVRADTAGLTDDERAAVEEMITVGQIFHRLYEDSLHPEAARVRHHLESYRPVDEAEQAHLGTLRQLYWMFRGPIVINLLSDREPLGPIEPYAPQRGIYPVGSEAEQLMSYAEAHPEAGLLEVRSLVRRREAEALAEDLRTLDLFPEQEALHPDLRAFLEGAPDPQGFYAVPYSLAYAEEMYQSSMCLRRAAELVREDDEDLADYLEQRGRDLLSNDYEAGDAAWVSGRPQRLNAQIGAYETYDDHLLGLKAFFSLSILIRDPSASAELERVVEHLPDLEAQLPGGPHGWIRGEIPIGVFDVLADFGQARGTNTASILPNESHIVRRYGRIILIRQNILNNPSILEISQRRFRAALAEEHTGDLGESGDVDRTVFHEVGHYLGPKRTEEGRTITEALGNLNNHMEELKADLIALWLMPRLVELGVIDESRMRSAYAAGVLRVLQTVEPAPDQAYAVMKLMQQRFFLDRGLIRYERVGDRGVLHVNYERIPEVVTEMLGMVIDLQRRGDRNAVEAFVRQWARWDLEVQGVIGRAVDEAAPRYRLVQYEVLEGR